jgi:hypothetical protein
MSQVKEPHYYSIDLRNRVIRNKDQYERLFREATSAHISVGEASTWYLYSQEAIPAILREHRDARCIVMTRDPIEMAHSLYHHNLRVLHEDCHNFEEAWALQAERMRGRYIPRTCTEPVFLQYKAACALGSQLKRLSTLVSAEHILHISLSAIKENPAKEYLRALTFLGLPDDDRLEFPVENIARGRRSIAVAHLTRIGARLRSALRIDRGFGLARINDKPFPKQPLSDQFRVQLMREFEADKQLFSDMVVYFENTALNQGGS